MKVIVVVIDGAADSPALGPTSLELAETPALAALAKSSVAGCFYPIDDKTAPESDAAVFSLLGYDPKALNIGRGLLEALGVGLRLREGFEVAFRANFATVDPVTRRIIDRRAGRVLLPSEAKELAKTLDGAELMGGECYARVVATVGHRAVVVLGCRDKRLSADVSNTDPAYGRVGRLSIALERFEPYIAPCRPLSDTEEAKLTCRLVDEFTEKAMSVLEHHEVNTKRAARGLLKANAIVLRDAEDRYPAVEPIERLYGMRFGIVAEMPVERGIGALLGMEVAEVGEPTGDLKRDLAERLAATLELLKKVDVVYVHLKGPDEPGHDGDKRGKVKRIEDLDRYFVGPLLERIDPSSTAIIVTADHATPPELRAHSADLVPIIVSYKGFKSFDPITKFTERECCSKGSLGTLPHGFMVLRKVFPLLRVST